MVDTCPTYTTQTIACIHLHTFILKNTVGRLCPIYPPVAKQACCPVAKQTCCPVAKQTCCPVAKQACCPRCQSDMLSRCQSDMLSRCQADMLSPLPSRHAVPLTMLFDVTVNVSLVVYTNPYLQVGLLKRMCV